jgi:hypothetical protein
MKTKEVLPILKEMRDACAACFRVIASNNLVKEFEEELVRKKIKPGFGVRCQDLIKKLEKGGK